MTELIASAVEHVAWYHTFDLPGGIVTRGIYDLRNLPAGVLPADLSGKRCLDACSATGFWAFAMEQRGAKEVVAIDVPSVRDRDWRLPWRAPDIDENQGAPFQIVKQALGSQVEREALNVYDVDPARLGEFDVVFIGSVLLHLRDPVKALRALRTVTRETFISFEPILLWQSMLHRRSPRGFMADGDDARWWTPNAAGHRAWVTSAGFEILETSRHRQRFGGQQARFPKRRPRLDTTTLSYWLALRHLGVPSQRIFARPRDI
jgi:tRNA (mo5U34)-methyltransferase